MPYSTGYSKEGNIQTVFERTDQYIVDLLNQMMPVGQEIPQPRDLPGQKRRQGIGLPGDIIPYLMKGGMNLG